MANLSRGLLHSARAASADMARDERWQMYVVRCADRSLYCGVTVDLERRVAQHNGELSGGGKYTRAKRPVTLVGQTCLLSRSNAMEVERWFKRMDAASKRRIIRRVMKDGMIGIAIHPCWVRRELARERKAVR